MACIGQKVDLLSKSRINIKDMNIVILTLLVENRNPRETQKILVGRIFAESPEDGYDFV